MKAPSAPVNLTLLETRVDGGSRTLTIVWQPPRSDLPLKDYQVYRRRTFLKYGFLTECIYKYLKFL